MRITTVAVSQCLELSPIERLLLNACGAAPVPSLVGDIVFAEDGLVSEIRRDQLSKDMNDFITAAGFDEFFDEAGRADGYSIFVAVLVLHLTLSNRQFIDFRGCYYQVGALDLHSEESKQDYHGFAVVLVKDSDGSIRTDAIDTAEWKAEKIRELME